MTNINKEFINKENKINSLYLKFSQYYKQIYEIIIILIIWEQFINLK
jgi:hypothetical protein